MVSSVLRLPLINHSLISIAAISEQFPTRLSTDSLKLPRSTVTQVTTESYRSFLGKGFHGALVPGRVILVQYIQMVRSWVAQPPKLMYLRHRYVDSKLSIQVDTHRIPNIDYAGDSHIPGIPVRTVGSEFPTFFRMVAFFLT